MCVVTLEIKIAIQNLDFDFEFYLNVAVDFNFDWDVDVDVIDTKHIGLDVGVDLNSWIAISIVSVCSYTCDALGIKFQFRIWI